MTEHKIVAKAEKQVKEWIDYAKQEYGWEDKVFELFEEPMIEVATAVAVQTIKDLQKELNDANEKVVYFGCQFSKAFDLLKGIVDLIPDEVRNHSYYYDNFVKPVEDFIKENK